MAGSNEITVMASAAIKAAFLDLAPQFERSSAHKVTALWMPTVDMMQRLSAGEAVDMVILTAAAIDELIALGRLAPARIDLTRSRVGMAVRAGAPRPDVSSLEAFKGSMLAAPTIAYSTGPSGVHIEALFERMGIADALKAKAKQVKGEPVGALVARGEAEIGFQQVSELLPVPGIDLLSGLPPEVAKVTLFSAGVHVASGAPEVVRDFARFLLSPLAQCVLRQKGLEPIDAGERHAR